MFIWFVLLVPLAMIVVLFLYLSKENHASQPTERQWSWSRDRFSFCGQIEIRSVGRGQDTVASGEETYVFPSRHRHLCGQIYL